MSAIETPKKAEKPETDRRKRQALLLIRAARATVLSLAGLIFLVALLAGSTGTTGIAGAQSPSGSSALFAPIRQMFMATTAHVDRMINAAELRSRSEAELKRLFDEEQEGLWDEWEHGAKGGRDKPPPQKDLEGAEEAPEVIEDEFAEAMDLSPYLRSLFIPPKNQAEPVPSGLGGAVSADPRIADFKVPLGPLLGTLPAAGLPLIRDEEGGGQIGDDGGEGPEVPFGPAPPAAEVPLPAPLLLFPAGLALFLRLRRRASA